MIGENNMVWIVILTLAQILSICINIRLLSIKKQLCKDYNYQYNETILFFPVAIPIIGLFISMILSLSEMQNIIDEIVDD
jgi:hypothetical protein